MLSHRHNRWRQIPALALTAVLLTGVLGPAAPQGLRARLESTKQRILGVQSDIRKHRAEQAAARKKVQAAQKQLAEAQARLRTAQNRLADTQHTLAQVRTEHKATQAHLQKHSGMMAARLLALYRNEQPSYIEVVLNATDFEDFTNRAEFTARVAGQDENVLTDLANTKRELEHQATVLHDTEIEQAKRVGEVATEKRHVAVRTEEAQQVLARADKERAYAEEQLAELEKASQEISEMLVRVQSGQSGAHYMGTWSGRLLRPVDGEISSPYGWRIHPILGTRRFHDGVDLRASYGTPIHAADKGLVVHAGWWGAYGNTVIIDHGSGISTFYGHMSSIAVGDGQVVKRGQVIGYVGSTGWSTGPHLHFGARKNGQRVNPMDL